MAKPLILVSNDDGVAAAGLQALAHSLVPLGEVVVVAPSEDQSAVSHAMTLRHPLRLRALPRWKTPQGSIEVYSVDGTPTDAVYMGVHHVLHPRKPTLVLSGINHGGNLGNDVLYSGTVSAAMEGVLLDVPSVAFSLVADHGFDFAPAAGFAHKLCAKLLTTPLPAGMLLNVNVPKHKCTGQVAMTQLGSHAYSRDVEERKDPRGQSYYWIGGHWVGYKNLPGTDCKAIAEGHISITPLRIDLTEKELLPWLKGLSVESYSSEKD